MGAHDLDLKTQNPPSGESGNIDNGPASRYVRFKLRT